MEKPQESLLTTKVFKIGGSKAIILPEPICSRLGIEEEDIIHLGVKEGKYGDCFSGWDHKKQIKEYERQNISDKYDSEKGETLKGTYADMKVNRKYKE